MGEYEDIRLLNLLLKSSIIIFIVLSSLSIILQLLHITTVAYIEYFPSTLAFLGMGVSVGICLIVSTASLLLAYEDIRLIEDKMPKIMEKSAMLVIIYLIVGEILIMCLSLL